MRPFLILILTAAAAFPQAVKFESTTQLVVVNVSAKTRAGEPLPDLKASDFTLTEDGKPQQIKVFEYQQMTETVLPPPPLKTREGEKSSQAAATTATIAPSKSGQVRYKDRRLLVLFFDLAGMSVSEQLRTQQAALQFLNARITGSDLVAVMTYVTDLNVLQDFSDDRDRLTAVIKALPIGENGQSNGSTGDVSEGDSGSAYTADDSEFNIFNTDRKLAALASASKMLSSLPEKKALVYFASGMTRTGIDNQAQLQATVNAAIRANVAFYTVDARGLVASAPLGDATQASQGGQGMYSGASQRSAQANFQAQQETLYALASDTGARHCSIRTTSRWASCKHRKIYRATTFWVTTARIRLSTGATGGSKSRSAATRPPNSITAAAISPARSSIGSTRPTVSASSRRP
jgi:VWFA-related protein